MSSMMHPVGPQSPSVYWVRRVLVLIVLAVIVGLIVWLVVGRDGGSGAGAAPAVSSSPTPGTSPSPSASPKPSPSLTPKPSSSSSSSSSGKPGASATPATCKESAITVLASTDAASYPVGATPRLRMRITNSSGTSCLRDVGALANTLVVNKAGTKFWSSDDCSPGGSPDVVTLDPGESYSVTLTWSGHASQQGCPANQPAATAGNYDLVGRNGNVYSSPQRFSLTG